MELVGLLSNKTIWADLIIKATIVLFNWFPSYLRLRLEKLSIIYSSGLNDLICILYSSEGYLLMGLSCLWCLECELKSM